MVHYVFTKYISGSFYCDNINAKNYFQTVLLNYKDETFRDVPYCKLYKRLVL